MAEPWSHTAIVVTCEHASAVIPPEARAFFRGASATLRTHRAVDLGVVPLAEALAARLAAPLFLGSVSRLVVELNRSLDNPGLFSEFTRDLPADERESIVRRYYTPYRSAVESHVREQVERARRVLHISAHTMTDELNGDRRDMHAAWLYDPASRAERDTVDRWMAAVSQGRPDLVLARNKPYKGTDDGLTTRLRTLFPADSYAGIEIELNQGLLRRGRAYWRALCDSVAEAAAP